MLHKQILLHKLCSIDCCKFDVKVTNPTHSPMSVILLPFCEERMKSSHPVPCGKVSLPRDSYEVPAKDTLAEFECSVLPPSSNEDALLVRFSQPNKLGFRCQVALDENFDASKEDRWVALRLKHDYTDTLNQKSEPVWITHTIFINLKQPSIQ